MKLASLILCALLIPSLARADRELRNGPDVIRLTQNDCPTEILAALPADIPPRVRDSFRAASATVDGATFRACWILLGNGAVFLRYEDGDSGMVPWQDFRIVPEA
jgi:hypothetical protein